MDEQDLIDDFNRTAAKVAKSLAQLREMRGFFPERDRTSGDELEQVSTSSSGLAGSDHPESSEAPIPSSR